MNRLAIFFLLVGSFLGAELPEPYASIRLQGLVLNKTTFHETDCLIELLDHRAQAVVVFVNPGLGDACMEFLQEAPSGHQVLAVSRWDLVEYDKEPNHSYHLFLSNIIQTGFAERVRPIRMNSPEAVKAYGIVPDAVFVIGEQSTGLYVDIEPWIERGCELICGTGVFSQAIRGKLEAIAQKHGFNLVVKNNFWHLKRG